MAISDITGTALEVLRKRYLIKDERGETIETVEQMFRRVAATVAAADLRFGTCGSEAKALEERFYQMMTSLAFLPNSPTLMNAGRPLGQLSACFVLPIGDSMEEIFEAVKDAALIHKSGGGTGFSFSRLRPAGSTVNSTGGVASGPVSFMRVFNMATEAVKQGGTRRGANMGILRVDHPDIMAFIDCKKSNADIVNFNISVGLTEEFMRAQEQGEEYGLIDPHTGQAAGSLSAGEVFEHIVDAAWRNGEPGIVFLDRLNRDNVVPGQGQIEATNPCGEQPLLPYESCNLGSINLSRMLRQRDTDDPKVKSGQTALSYAIDWQQLSQTVAEAVHFLDNVIEINSYPLPLIADTTKATRKIGLGVMGFADMLLALDVPYASEEALELAERIMAYIATEARRTSHQLALERGSFPLFAESVYAGGEAMRNATTTTIAPTGTLSIIAGCSSGVEPVFSFVFLRRIMDGDEFLEVNPILRARLEAAGLYSEELMRQVAAAASLEGIDAIPADIRRVFMTAHDVSPLYHIRMQAAFQRHTDNAVSKTVNFPSTATHEDVAEVFVLAFKEGCKGVTIYRDGSRDSQVLSVIGADNAGAGADGDKGSASGGMAGDEQSGPGAAGIAGGGAVAALPVQAFGEIMPRLRPAVTSGFTEQMKIGCGNLYVTVNYDQTGICEVFTSTGKAGGCPSQSEATARLASVALRSGMSVKSICNQLKGIRCPSTVRQDSMSCTSCPDAIARVLMKVDEHIRRGGSLTAEAIKPSQLIKNSRGKMPGAAADAAADSDEMAGDGAGGAEGANGWAAGLPGAAAAVLPGCSPSGSQASQAAEAAVAAGATAGAAAGAAAAAAAEAAPPVLPGQYQALCPECFEPVQHEGACVVCRNCGYSKCG